MTHTNDIKMHAHQARAGFSLIEIMIALVIVGVVAVAGFTGMTTYLNYARKSTTKMQMQNLKQAVTLYNAHTARYPQNLRDLIKKPQDEWVSKKWEGPYLGEGATQAPPDGWGNRFQYKVNPQGSKRPYELYSFGPNGRSGPKSEHISVWDV